jgi:Tol biopolymer transport system component
MNEQTDAAPKTRAAIAALALMLMASCAPSSQESPPAEQPQADAELRLPEEVHLRNVRQLTFGGENAEAYFSPDGKYLIFQSKRDDLQCDQIFIMEIESGSVEMVSSGEGQTTCAFFFPDGERILYSSTHLAGAACPPPPDRSKGYVWRLHPEFDIFVARRDGSERTRITDQPGYDAEATISPDGSRIIFTSLRDGDLDLYTMNPDGTDVRRITTEFGYDGGAFYSRDGERIVWRASRPQTDEEIEDYKELLEASAIRPMNLEIFVAAADGSGATQVTSNGSANFAPYFFPDGRRIIFASNAEGGGRNFDLWMVHDDGSGLERVTFHPDFDGFPMFSPDGKHLVFASNRAAVVEGETNVFLAEWVDTPEPVTADH